MKKCVMCGSKLQACLECGEFFHSTNEKHVLCRGRCRTRRHRRLAELAFTTKGADGKGDVND